MEDFKKGDKVNFIEDNNGKRIDNETYIVDEVVDGLFEKELIIFGKYLSKTKFDAKLLKKAPEKLIPLPCPVSKELPYFGYYEGLDDNRYDLYEFKSDFFTSKTTRGYGEDLTDEEFYNEAVQNWNDKIETIILSIVNDYLKKDEVDG